MLVDAQQLGARRAGPKPAALAGSVALHAALVGWMFFGPSLGSRTPPEQPKNLYQQVIAGNEKKLVWYNFRDKLPQVSPLERHGISRPPRAEIKTAKQTIVANPPNAKRAQQMVDLPAPPRLDREVQAPNLFAFAAPELPPPDRPPAKLFAPPPEVMRALSPPEPLPDAPQVAANTTNPELAQPDSLARPKPKEFVPPQEAKREQPPASSLPDAPKVAAISAKVELPEPQRPRPRTFVPPPEAKRETAASTTVPEAPKVTATQPAPRMPPRSFVPAPERKRAAAAVSVPEAPQVTSTTAKLTLPPAPKIAPRKFVPPRDSGPFSPGSAAVPDAPKVAGTRANVELPSAPKIAPRKFTPPRESGPSSPGPAGVPDAPKLAGTQAKMELPQAPKIQARKFVPPQEAKPSPATSATAAALPDAPAVGGDGRPGGLRLSFVPPAEPSRQAADAKQIESAPEVEHVSAAGSLTAVIVGLNPAVELKALPEASRPAAISSAPKRREDGGTGEPVESARLFVPNLMIRDGAANAPDATPGATIVKGIMRAAVAPTSTENLMQAAKAAPILRSEVRLPGIQQVPDAPDPRFSGRIVYMVAIQMPNVTSFIGSWIMWFADREPMPGQVREMRAPVPVRKVDPKYVASAAAERVEGKVQLAAVIRGDGHVDSITVIKRVDDRLDFAAAEALRKWEFEPARRDGRPIDVDAIFEIPFRLEPVATR